METRILNGTSLQTSRLALGTMTFGSQVDQSGATEMVRRALDLGITHYDTANAYNGGESERLLGTALGARRGDALLASKVYNAMGPGTDDRGLSPAAIRKAIDASLSRLGTDYLDLYYLHQPDAQIPVEESMGAMTELVESGKVRFVGASNYAAWQLAAMRETATQTGCASPRVSQVMYNLITRRIEDEYLSCAQNYDISTVVYNPLAGGLLTGKHSSSSTPADGSRFSNPAYRERYWTQSQFDAVDRLRTIAKMAHASLVELSLRWLLAQDAVDAVILGASSVSQFEANVTAALGPELETGTLDACDEVWNELNGPTPRYNR